MKIKETGCFLVAFAATVIIAIVSAICSPFTGNRVGFIGQTGFVLLQVVLIVKYAVVLLLIMPNRFIFRQVIYGFLSADVIIAAATLINKSHVSFSACFITVQIVFMCFYRFFEREKPSAIGGVNYTSFKNGFMMDDKVANTVTIMESDESSFIKGSEITIEAA